ncbi:hypothetical protein C8N24_3614 [Solirubrobacter pauli]|uniref:Uncharacterized protein n=1 Tax=Solirubrobacter pauli TaxID=166793 RepID=A0A660LID7_9ACTN|nr:hypothetical protein C8N24_3614 [Solirubrobacter pauli]
MTRKLLFALLALVLGIVALTLALSLVNGGLG